MAENGHLIAYLIVEKGTNGNKKTYWRPLGAAYPCRDGSLNLKLDIHPGLTFNLRPPKSNGEQEEVNDRTFNCDDCEQLFADEEAHLTSTNGVVCDKCNSKYRLCASCDRVFLKSIPSNTCPTCK